VIGLLPSASANAGGTGDAKALLGLLRLPARLNAEQVAALLGFEAWDIPSLVRHDLLKPLGDSAKRNRVKFFSSVEVIKYAEDRRWLDKATRAVSRTSVPKQTTQEVKEVRR
jgi:hypothetical protein